MMNKTAFSLSKRLQGILEMAESGDTVIDIGTDHAYVPIALIQNRCYRLAIASDINRNALEIASKNIQANHLESEILCSLSDGLDRIEQTADCIILAGMGGETIADILDNARLKALAAERIIAQPQSKTELFRSRILKLGLYPVDERILYEDGHFYILMRLEKNPSVYKQCINLFGHDMFLLYGLLPLLATKEQSFKAFVTKKISDCEKILSSASHLPSDDSHIARIKKNLILSKKLVSEGSIL